MVCTVETLQDRCGSVAFDQSSSANAAREGRERDVDSFRMVWNQSVVRAPSLVFHVPVTVINILIARDSTVKLRVAKFTTS